jgi:thioredoxin 1
MIEIAKFSRPGCRPCAVITNYLDDLADHPALEGVVISEYNALNVPDLVEKYGLASVPVLIFSRNGIEITRITGMTDQETILDCVKMAREER